jgi:hypothetical protein
MALPVRGGIEFLERPNVSVDRSTRRFDGDDHGSKLDRAGERPNPTRRPD